MKGWEQRWREMVFAGGALVAAAAACSSGGGGGTGGVGGSSGTSGAGGSVGTGGAGGSVGTGGAGGSAGTGGLGGTGGSGGSGGGGVNFCCNANPDSCCSIGFCEPDASTTSEAYIACEDKRCADGGGTYDPDAGQKEGIGVCTYPDSGAHDAAPDGDRHD